MKRYFSVSIIRFIVNFGVMMGLCSFVQAVQPEERLKSDILLKTVKKNANSKKVNKMTSLVLKITTDKATVLSGESVNVSVKLTNSGNVSIDAYPDYSPDEFEYILKSKDGKIDLLLSETQDLLNKIGEPIPPMPDEFVSLQPGDTRVYKVDIADYSNIAIPVGQYTLLATLEKGGARFESMPIDLSVEKINAQLAIMYAASYINDLSMILSHFNNETKSITIYHKKSWPEMP
ncbi:MAG TPA: hypothetical protein ENJ08_17255, partial [Gammaproteobacteria bacterium]|nr:hypothetical protein [Gammaproteobacteria bacterium]